MLSTLRLVGVAAAVFCAAIPAALVAKQYGAIPVYFEQNRGQSDARTLYIARAPGMLVKIGRDRVSFSDSNSTVSMRIDGANPSARIEGESVLGGVTHYYKGPRQILNVPHYARVRVSDVRPGIDMVYYAAGTRLEYDLVVKPGADPRNLTLRFEGAGVHPELTAAGDVVVGGFRSHQPVAWQESATGRTDIATRYRLDPATGAVSFEVSDYDRTRPLIMDPILSYSTFLGGSTGYEEAVGIAVDSTGAAYVTGSTQSSDFPITSKVGGSSSSYDVFVTKLNPSGTAVIYSVVFGGQSEDRSRAIALDSSGNAWVTGSTYSSDFPSTDGSKPSSQDVFVAKIAPAGTLALLTSFGGSSTETGTAVAVNASNNLVYVTGTTSSTNFPTTAGAHRVVFAGGNSDGFVVRLTGAGVRDAATLIGGVSDDSPAAIAVNSATGVVAIAGYTWSAGFPVTGTAAQSTLRAGPDAFLSVFNAGLTSLSYSTFLGGAGGDYARGLALDGNGDYYLGGYTDSSDFPATQGAFKGVKNYYNDGFITKIGLGGSIVYSTFLGDGSDDYLYAIAVDGGGNAVVAGSTRSSNFPTTPGALRSRTAGNYYYETDVFVSKLNATGSVLSYSTLLGSTGDDSAYGIALDGQGAAYITGATYSQYFPTTPGALQDRYPKPSNYTYYDPAFISKIDLTSTTICGATVSPSSVNMPGRGGTVSFTLTVPQGCPWEASTDSGLTLNGALRGMGGTPVTINLSVSLNDYTSSGRTLTVRFGATTFTVNQEAGSCLDPVLVPASLGFDSQGGIRNLSITLPSSCPWAVVPSVPWLSVTSGQSGTGAGSAILYAPPNSFAARSTTLNIASKTVAVTQSGGSCTASLTPGNGTFPAQGGAGITRISTSASSCSWTAHSFVPWIQPVAESASGEGSRAVAFRVAENPGATSRTGAMLIGDQTFTITQAAGPYGVISSYTSSIFAGRPSYYGSTGDGGPATGATLDALRGLAFDSATKKLYIAEYTRIRVVTADGIIDTFAGGGASNADDIAARTALIFPDSLALGSAGALYFNDGSYRVRKIAGGIISTVAGTGNSGNGGEDVPASTSPIGNVAALAADSVGNLYIGDIGYNKLRRVNGGNMSTYAGGGSVFADNVAPTATTLRPNGIGLTADGTLYVSDSGNARIRKITPGSSPVISTFAGGGTSTQDGVPATSASITPLRLLVEENGGVLFSDSSRLRRVDRSGNVNTIANNIYASGLAADPDGNIYYSDGSYVVRKLTPVPNFCAFAVNAPAAQSASGGSVALTLTGGAGCPWIAASDLAWASITSASSGTGPGSITLSISANTSTIPRNGVVFVAGQAVTITQAGVPVTPAVLSITKTHTGNFVPGQNGTYTVTVSNAATAGPTAGNVSVTDNLPSGLSLVSIGGTGWVCSGVICSRGDALAPGASYPPITVTVNVASSATSPQVNYATVSGGGSVSAVAPDSTVISVNTPPVLNLVVMHSGNFLMGQTDATYTIIVRNLNGAGPTNGTVTVTDDVPAYLTLTGMSGPGWTCSGKACTRSDVLQPDSAYPAITATVSVSTNAPTTVYNSVSVSGGGAATYTATDPTFITPQAPAEMISPVPGSTLTSSTVTFTWSAGTATQYELTAGTQGVGSIDLSSGGFQTSLSKTITGIPNGRTIYIRLRSYVGIWTFREYTYTSCANCSGGSGLATLVSPTPGSAFLYSAITFAWDAGTATEYHLMVGTSGPGSTEVYSQNTGTSRLRTVVNIPDGKTIYVRLWSNVGSWQYRDYTFTSCANCGGGPVLAAMTSPTPGTTFTSSTVAFSWDGGTGSEYHLMLGTSGAGSTDIYSQNTGAARSRTVSGIPDGKTIYVRLWSLAGGWQYRDYTYTSCANCSSPVLAAMTIPVPGTTFTSSTVTFIWDAGNGTEYHLMLGTTGAGSTDIYSQNTGTARTRTITNIPDGKTVYARLWSNAGSWQYRDYTYTSCASCGGAGPTLAAMTSPSPGSTFTSSTVTFNWEAGSGSEYHIMVGTTGVGSTNVYSQNTGAQRSRTVSNIPDVATVYVRLWSFTGTWQYRDYTYNSCANCNGFGLAAMITPAPGGRLTSTSVSFAWDAGSGTEYHLMIGTGGLGTYDLYSQNTGSQRLRSVSGLPGDGRTLYVRLWTLTTSWQYRDYVYASCSNCAGAVLAAMSAPVPGSTLTGSSVTFSWDAGVGATEYHLQVGTGGAGGMDVFSLNLGAQRSRTVTGLPRDGRTVFVRLWSFTGTWQYRDYTYTACSGCL